MRWCGYEQTTHFSLRRDIHSKKVKYDRDLEGMDHPPFFAECHDIHLNTLPKQPAYTLVSLAKGCSGSELAGHVRTVAITG